MGFWDKNLNKSSIWILFKVSFVRNKGETGQTKKDSWGSKQIESYYEERKDLSNPSKKSPST